MPPSITERIRRALVALKLASPTYEDIRREADEMLRARAVGDRDRAAKASARHSRMLARMAATRT